MENIINGLANLGGMGLLSAALFYLHRDALKAFREELAKERELWTVAREADRVERAHAHESLRAEKLRLHAELLAELKAVSAKVAEFGSRLDRLEHQQPNR